MMDTDKLALWGFILAILALVFHIPLSMAAHHYLPKVENYFASRSRKRLTKRIAKLQRRLARLNDPAYFEDLEWVFREHLFVVFYLVGTGLFLQAAILFSDTGAVRKTGWFWNASTMPLGNHLPELAVCSFIAAVLLAGWNMFTSTFLRPSKRPALRLKIQAQIDSLKTKLDSFE